MFLHKCGLYLVTACFIAACASNQVIVPGPSASLVVASHAPHGVVNWVQVYNGAEQCTEYAGAADLSAKAEQILPVRANRPISIDISYSAYRREVDNKIYSCNSTFTFTPQQEKTYRVDFYVDYDIKECRTALAEQKVVATEFSLIPIEAMKRKRKRAIFASSGECE